jgi:hypothetical protein
LSTRRCCIASRRATSTLAANSPTTPRSRRPHHRFLGATSCQEGAQGSGAATGRHALAAASGETLCAGAGLFRARRGALGYRRAASGGALSRIPQRAGPTATSGARGGSCARWALLGRCEGGGRDAQTAAACQAGSSATLERGRAESWQGFAPYRSRDLGWGSGRDGCRVVPHPSADPAKIRPTRFPSLVRGRKAC